MSEEREIVETGAITGTVLPPVAELPEIKLFNRWSCDDVQVSDMSLQVRPYALYVHTEKHGRHSMPCVRKIEWINFSCEICLKPVDFAM